jgi:hypothetical protein
MLFAGVGKRNGGGMAWRFGALLCVKTSKIAQKQPSWRKGKLWDGWSQQAVVAGVLSTGAAHIGHASSSCIKTPAPATRTAADGTTPPTLSQTPLQCCVFKKPRYHHLVATYEACEALVRITCFSINLHSVWKLIRVEGQ